ncbi:MAG: hypothetical protein IPK68_18555 [Bdellovibrionales bacterium]|nr:hypothetical protein [Bdellovibrionales bacterium]
MEPRNSINGLKQKPKISRFMRLGSEIIFSSVVLFLAAPRKPTKIQRPPPAQTNEDEVVEEQDPQSETRVLTLPLEVYLYDFAGEPDYSSTLDEEEVADLVAKANEIYSQAEIKFNVVSIVKKTISAAMFDIVQPEDTTSTKQKF